MTVPAGEPSIEFGERRGVSPPVLHPPVSRTILRFQPAALRLAARSGLGREARGSVLFSPTPEPCESIPQVVELAAIRG